jgi:ferredoxin
MFYLGYTSRMRIVVDSDLCEGFAACVKVMPDVFVLGDDLPVTIRIPRPDESRRAELLDAVARCPRAALTIDES